MDQYSKYTTEEVPRLMKRSLLSFWASLITGTVLFGLCYLSTAPLRMVIIGFFYVIPAFFINAIILMDLLICISLYKERRRELLLRCALMLLNLPVAFGYFLIVINT